MKLLKVSTKEEAGIWSRNNNNKKHTKSSKTALVKGGTKQEGLTSKGQEETVRDV